jgi:hypothetical protein
VEHLALAPVDDLPGTLADLHARGLRIVGADGEAPLTARDADLRGPIAIVVGSEGKGLGPAIRRRCDLVVRIPMHGRIESLNASVAGSILLYEAAAQRRLPDPGPRAAEESAQSGDAADETFIGEAGKTPDPEPPAGHDAEPLTEADAKPTTATAREADAGVAQASPSERAPELPTADDATSESAAASALASEPDPAPTDAQGKAKAKRTRRVKPVEAEPAPSPDLADLLPEAPAAAAPEV